VPPGVLPSAHQSAADEYPACRPYFSEKTGPGRSVPARDGRPRPAL